MLSELRTRKLTAFFNTNDQNRDGVIEQADYDTLIQNLANLRGWMPGTPEYRRLQEGYMVIWKSMQADRLSLDEYLQACDAALVPSPEMQQWNKSIADTVFDIIDFDADGKLNLAEYSQYMAAHHHMGGQETDAENAFKRMDSDSDGYITREQFEQISYDFVFSEDANTPANWLWGSY